MITVRTTPLPLRDNIFIKSLNMNNFEGKINRIEKQEKPEFLYHASGNKDIKEFEPRRKKMRDHEEGQVIFATPNLALASAFLMNELDDSWSHKGDINGIPYAVIKDKDLFTKFDKGGSIYKLPSDSFNCDLNKGMGKFEWISRENVKPIDKIDYDSTLTAMLNNGLQVYFINEDTFSKINNLKMPVEVIKLIKILQGLKSENQLRNINYKKFI